MPTSWRWGRERKEWYEEGNRSPLMSATAGTWRAGGHTALVAPLLTIVVPTFNERDNIPTLIERLRITLTDCDWEVVIVDDNSPDGTALVARGIGELDRRVRCIRRIGRRGLSGACLEGALSSQATYVAVMDGDLQHDEARLTTMLERIRVGDVDLVVASRYADGGSSRGLSGWRTRISHWSNAAARRLLHLHLTDPLSGFFIVRRTVIEQIAPSLSSQGFKILLDIVATARGKLRIAEIPYSFRGRESGESKLDARVALDFVGLTVGKLTANAISGRFVLFCLVGLTGVALHLVLLRVGITGGLPFEVAQTLSTTLVIAWNFMLNNALTYRDQRLVGWQFLNGLVRFEIICGIGLISNVGIASWIYGSGQTWWVAGLGGALMGAVWNYVVSAALIWRQR